MKNEKPNRLSPCPALRLHPRGALDFIPSAWLRTGINYNIKYRMGKALFGPARIGHSGGEDETEAGDE